MGEWKTPLSYAIRLLWYTSFLHLKAKSGMECENAELLEAYPLAKRFKTATKCFARCVFVDLGWECILVLLK